MNRRLLVLAALSLSAAGLATLASACSDDPQGDGTLDGDAGDAAPDRRVAVGEDSAAGDVDARADASTCELTRAYTLECNLGTGTDEPLNCGAAGFDSWCAANDKAVNSAAFRRAEALCLIKKNCDGFDRRDCEYRSYASATPTSAQKALVAAYCQTCEPTNADCAARKTDYDPALGPKGVDDVFVAAWELNDKLVDDIRTQCTGAALDGGAAALDAGGDAAPCLKGFGGCAADVYLNAVPDCP